MRCEVVNMRFTERPLQLPFTSTHWSKCKRLPLIFAPAPTSPSLNLNIFVSLILIEPCYAFLDPTGLAIAEHAYVSLIRSAVEDVHAYAQAFTRRV